MSLNNYDDDDGDNYDGEGPFREVEIREQDRYLPVANIARIMKKVLPNNAKIAKDAKEGIQECVSEFISFITSEASDKCQQEKRKTINGDDILWAMTTLGFDKYIEPLKLYLAKYRDSVKNEKPEKKAAPRPKESVFSPSLLPVNPRSSIPSTLGNVDMKIGNDLKLYPGDNYYAGGGSLLNPKNTLYNAPYMSSNTAMQQPFLVDSINNNINNNISSSNINTMNNSSINGISSNNNSNSNSGSMVPMLPPAGVLFGNNNNNNNNSNNNNNQHNSNFPPLKKI